MIKEILILVFIGLFVYILYNGISNFMEQTGRIIAKTTKVFTKFDYYLTSFNTKNGTKIVITFVKPINFTCIERVLINNKTYNYEYSVISENMLEINIDEKLKGTYDLKIDFCEGTIIDTILVQ